MQLCSAAIQRQLRSCLVLLTLCPTLQPILPCSPRFLPPTHPLLLPAPTTVTAATGYKSPAPLTPHSAPSFPSSSRPARRPPHPPAARLGPVLVLARQPMRSGMGLFQFLRPLYRLLLFDGLCSLHQRRLRSLRLLASVRLLHSLLLLLSPQLPCQHSPQRLQS